MDVSPAKPRVQYALHPNARAQWEAVERALRAQREEWVREFIRFAGGPREARKLLTKVSTQDERLRRRPRGRQLGRRVEGQTVPDLDVYALAAAIHKQEGWGKRRALLAAMRLKGIPEDDLRRLEDRIRGKTLAQAAAEYPVTITGRVSV